MSYGNGEAGRAYTASAPPGIARQSQISEQMQALEKRTEVLHNIIAELEGRITTVLGPDTPSAQPGGKDRSQPSVQLGASLMQMNDRVQSACDRLQSLIGRVEL